MTRHFKKNKKSTSGFSLAELAVVLAIVALLFSGIWTAAGNTNRNVKQQKFSELLYSVSESVRGHYAGKPYFESTNVGTMMGKLTQAQMNVFPGDALRYVNPNWLVISPFGEHTNPFVGSSPYKSFYVCGWQTSGSTHCDVAGGSGANNVPLFALEALFLENDCVAAALRNSNSATLPGLVAVVINGTFQTLPLTLAAANSACVAGVNYADWVFRLTP
jgi:prepilin-type N-terminal cleavage/methylation domain-containing protein